MNKLLLTGGLLVSGAMAFADQSTTLIATRSTDGNGYAVLTWDGDETAVYRAYQQDSANWTEIGTVSDGVQTFTDEEGYYGIKTYYKVGEKVVSFTRMRRLGQNEDGSLLEGVTILKEGTDYWSGGVNTGDKCFDGNTGTAGDVGDPSNPRIGLNFGRPCYIAEVRLITRANNEYGAGRVDRSIVFASSIDWESANATAISDPLIYGDWYAPLEWKTIVCNTALPYTLAYLRRNDGGSTNGNYSEIEFYGWYASDMEGLTDPVTDMTVTMMSDKRISVSWVCTGTPDELVVERKTDSGDWAEYEIVYDKSGSTYSFIDADIAYDSTYAYRVTAKYMAFDVNQVSTIEQALCVEPVDLTMGYSDWSENYYAVLSWKNCDTIDGKEVAIYRAENDGEWELLDTVEAGVTTYTDVTARTYGARYRYRITPADEVKWSPIVTYYRVRRLDVRGTDGKPANATVYTAWGQNDNGWNAFDGNETTFSSMNAYGSPHFGLDFGSTQVFVGLIRVLPRQGQLDDERLNRLNGLTGYGTNSGSDFGKTAAVSASIPADRADKQSWVDLLGIPSGPWRYIYFWNDTWQGNAAEIQIYGWTQLDIENQLGKITDIRVMLVDDGKIDIEWDCAGEPSSYQIERKIGDGEWSTLKTVVAGDAEYESHVFIDTATDYGKTYAYRVSAVYSTTSFVSEEKSASCYELADFAVGYNEEFKYGYAALSWKATTAFANGVKILRKQDDGDFEFLASVPAGTVNYVDKTVRFGGIRYTYYLQAMYGEAFTEAIDFVRLRHLERKDAGTFADGVSLLVYSWHNWGGPFEPACFDGDINTFPDMGGGDVGSWVRAGVDFGVAQNYYVAKVRMYPRGNYGLPPNGDRQTGTTVGGILDGGDWVWGSPVALSSSLRNVESTARWYEFECDPSVAYRYMFLYNTERESCGNWAEVEFWGWTDRDLHGAFILIIR